jgi:hypothetical protein
LPLPAAVIAIVIVTRGERIKTAESEASEVMAIVVAVKTSGREIAVGRSKIVRRTSEVAAGAGEIARTGRPRDACTAAAGKSGTAARHRRAATKSTAAVGHRGAAATAHVAAAATAEPTTAAAAAMVLSHGRCRDRRRAQNRGGRNCHHVFAHDFKLPVHKNCARDQ